MIRRLAMALWMCVALAATPTFACDIVSPSTANAGTLSPTAVTTAGYFATTGSFKCTNTSVLSLLATDYLRATVTTATAAMVLTATTGGSVTYLLSATPDASGALASNVRRSYMEGTTIALLTSKAAPPIYVKPVSATAPPAGIYKGTFQILWSWRFCDGVAVLGACVLADVDKGDKTATVNITMTVAKNAVVTISQNATWQGSTPTTYPKAIPGSKLRMMMLIENPNPFALDADTLAVTLPTPAGLRVALDGDGTGSSPVIGGSNTTGVTGLTFSYDVPSNTGDDVDFASGNGVWGYVPTAGDATTQGNVTAVRFSPKGMMAANTAYTISIPYSVK